MKIKADWLFVVLLMLSISAIAPARAFATTDPFASPEFLQDVISQVENPYSYEWRRSRWHLALGIGYIDEQNNFESDAKEISLGFPFFEIPIVQLNLRFINVSETQSSRSLGRTPFLQESTVTRYELGVSLLYSLMDGVHVTRASPFIPDLESTLFVEAGVHYARAYPGGLRLFELQALSYPGMSPVPFNFGIEVGLEWRVFLPSSLGLRFGIHQHFFLPSGNDLKSAPYLMTGLVWGAQ